jgi:hypothetical protein
MKFRYFFLLICIFLSGCAGGGATRSEGPAPASDCVRPDLVRDFTALDRRSLIVYAPSRRQAFLVELALSCPDLPFSNALLLDGGRDGRVCGYGGDAIVVRGLPTERCAVSGVRRLDELELDELLAEHGKTPEPGPAGETEIEAPENEDDESP